MPLWFWKLQSSFTACINSANITWNPCQTQLWVLNKFPIVHSRWSQRTFLSDVTVVQKLLLKIKVCELHENLQLTCDLSSFFFFFSFKELVALLCEMTDLVCLKLSLCTVKADGMPVETSHTSNSRLTHQNLHVEVTRRKMEREISLLQGRMVCKHRQYMFTHSFSHTINYSCVMSVRTPGCVSDY